MADVGASAGRFFLFHQRDVVTRTEFAKAAVPTRERVAHWERIGLLPRICDRSKAHLAGRMEARRIDPREPLTGAPMSDVEEA